MFRDIDTNMNRTDQESDTNARSLREKIIVNFLGVK